MSSKTVFLIRHAESAENVLMQGVVRSLNAITSFSLPALSDLKGGVQLVSNVITGANDQCPLSSNGELQVSEVHGKLVDQRIFAQEDDDVQQAIRDERAVVAHSPMLRAKQTCYGLLTPEVFGGSSSSSIASTTNWIELELLREILPVEMVDSKRRALAPVRISEFESWLDSRPETHFFIVGHSHYFREMLGVSYKFSNCDVWRSTFLARDINTPDDKTKRWTDLSRLCGSHLAQATFGAEGPQAWN